jgi:uncharacterized protein involved in outer membrane biogenesis
MGKIKSIFLYIIIILLVLVLTRNLIVKAVIEGVTKTATGLTLSIASINIPLAKSTIGIRGLKLNNPEGFPEPVMLDMPVIYADYDIESLFEGKVHFRHLTLNLDEFFVVKNKAGFLNLNALKIAKKEKEKPAVSKKEAKKLSLKIDVLDLKIGRVVYKDYSKGIAPKIKEFKISINERYENITDINSFVSLLVVRALANTTISQLTGFDIGPIKGEVKDILKSVSKLTTNAATDTLKTGKDASAKVLDKIGVTTKKAVKTIEEIIPFSKKDTEE